MSFQKVGDIASKVDANADDEDLGVQQIESLCMNCGKNGMTRLLLTSIPYFREIIVMSFHCDHCGFQNSEVQSAGEIQVKGTKFVLRVEEEKDLERQIIKADSGAVKIVELDLEIPAYRGQFTDVQGLLMTVVDDLSAGQEERKEASPEVHGKVQEIIDRLKAMSAGKELPFTVVLDDPAGNSWIEFVPGDAQHKWSKTEYFRTPEQNEKLGLAPTADEESESSAPVENSGIHVNSVGDTDNPEDEVATFPATCPSCLRRCDTHMKLTDIPHFKQVTIMSTNCEYCGYKSNEVKTGGAIPDKGRKITLHVTDPEDLSRSLLKSETCRLQVPEIDLDLTPGTLGGRFTTVEGILVEVRDELDNKVLKESSDAINETAKEKWDRFFKKVQDAIDGKIKFTIILDDPLAASYIQNIYAPDPDPEMTVEDYERSYEQNDELGLNDMVV
ncbi:hypothetical protein CANCADRAFT_84009 [Tortispora caseinolytica NRRL Y-17796]|uniref:Zinc finger ZPR1-type domain-containing protein n=1 Tax=Tortispora caseinolytica NRRL Y-17796 TaxID=767744 RepID=A0A1E4TKC6_9ASCO|nr:hypothetical protein CANCADRAFT_84009 [Tortispora caseinolytica NRRL Y-17796]